MKKNRIIYLIIMISLSLSYVKAQDIKYFVTGGGGGYSKVRNTNMSPLLYKGINGQFELGFHSIQDGRMIEFKTAFFGGMLQPDINPELSSSEMTSLRLEINYKYLLDLKYYESQQLTWYGGFILGNRDQFRIHNKFSNNNYDGEYHIFLSLASTLQKEISLLNRRSFIVYGISFPLLSYMIGPSHSHPKPYDYLIDPEPGAMSFLKSGDFFSINKLFALKSGLKIVHILSNGNAIGLSYDWDIMINDAYKHTDAAGHYFSFSTYFNLSKND